MDSRALPSFRRQLDIAASPDTVYAALTTAAGLRGWWTENCDVDTAVGGQLHFRFGQTRKTLRIDSLVPAREVIWTCTAAHIAVDRLTDKGEWVGTRLVFRLTPRAGGGTHLDFTHEGLTPALACHDLCRDGWQHFLGSLQQLAETGRGTPWVPADCPSAEPAT